MFSWNKAFIFKLIFLGLFNAFAVWAAIILFVQRNYTFLGVLVLGVIIINYVYLSKKNYHLKYIVPGTIFMVLLIIVPIFYTVYVSFTNYGTGNMLDKEQAINQITGRHHRPEDPREFYFSAFKDEDTDEIFVLFEDREDGSLFLGENDQAVPVDHDDPRLEDTTGDGEIDTFADLEKMDRSEVIQNVSRLERKEFQYDDSLMRMRDLNRFALYRRSFEYHEDEDKIVDLRTGEEYFPEEGHFVNAEGERLDPGFQITIGFDNYHRLITDPRITRPFIRVFIWTFQWAFLSVATTFALGLFVAILLNDKTMRFRRLYRVLLILPYAVPAFISVLIWRGMFNPSVGVVNRIIEYMGLSGLPWLQNIFWARVALVVINLWLGFPYMMLLGLGALQSIPGNLYEAAAIDGASRWQRFRHITLPMVLVALAPLLIASFAFNFNNFNVIYLFNEGRPAIAGAQTPAGGTDILISYTYRLSFEAGRGSDFGMASAVAVLVFMITAVLTWINFKYTGALEEVKENE